MAQYDYDLFTIGGGSGGVRASRVSAFYGAKVAIAEERYLGGTCVNVGCIPKKLLVYASHFSDGVEFAGIFHGLGADVTQLYHESLFLRGFDYDVRKTLAAEMKKRGIALRFNSDIEKIEKVPDGLRATVSGGATVTVDQILYATGRNPNTRSLGLGKAGVAVADSGAVIVDDYSKTTVDSIYAIGDCTDRLMLTPVAIAEGRAVAETLFNNNPMKPNYINVPSVVFSNPNIGTVGLTEKKAQERYRNIDVYKTAFKPLKHTLTGRDERTMMK